MESKTRFADVFRHASRRLSTDGGFGLSKRRRARQPSGAAGRRTACPWGHYMRLRVFNCPVREPNPYGVQPGHTRLKGAAAVAGAPDVCPVRFSPRRNPECRQRIRPHRVAAPLSRQRCGTCGPLPSCRRRSPNPKSPPIRRLDRLAVDDAGAGWCGAPFAHANLLAPCVADSLPQSLNPPLARVPANGSPWRIFLALIAPLAARTHEVKASLDDIAPRVFARLAQSALEQLQWLDQRQLIIRQVRRVVHLASPRNQYVLTLIR
jgi:hypothetical protein